jgi:hypothetical protein
VTNLDGARYLSGPLSHRTPARPHTYSAYPRTALATAGGRWAGRLGRSGPAQTGIHGPKARKAPACLKWESSVRRTDGSADTPSHGALRWWRTGHDWNIWIDL